MFDAFGFVVLLILAAANAELYTKAWYEHEKHKVALQIAQEDSGHPVKPTREMVNAAFNKWLAMIAFCVCCMTMGLVLYRNFGGLFQ